MSSNRKLIGFDPETYTQPTKPGQIAMFGMGLPSSNLPESVYAFPRQRKEPLTDASHVKNVLALAQPALGSALTN